MQSEYFALPHCFSSWHKKASLKMAVLKLIVFVAIPIAIAIYCFTNSGNVEIPKIEDGWWGRESPPPKDPDRPPVPFAVKASNATLADLRARLEKARFPSSLDGTAFEYGLNSDYLRKVVSYWKDTFNWDAQQAKLNSFPQFKVKIEGIDVHYVRVQPKKPSNSANEKRRAIMLIHGWPGSYWEFYKLIPLLMDTKSGDRTNQKESISFEIICPSIPGYGFSEAPHKPGFDALDAARVFMKLMKKLGHDKFYVQGGDWGSAISTLMAQAYPENILGVHLNFALPPIRSASLGPFVRLLIGEIWPSLIHSPAEIKVRLSVKQIFFNSMRESGYMHLQATKPDTVAAGLNDSPAGLAAYILEKFSSWSNYENIHCPDGCITKHFTLDEVLTNVMIYWLSGNIGSSMRFYKEYFTSDDVVPWDSVPVVVPSGIAAFPHELVQNTRSIAELRFVNIVRYTDFDRGGHFAALEVPELLAGDIKAFVSAVESLKH